MLGGYIGQFLPLSGGTLGGALNLAGHDLDYLGNISDSAGNVRIQIVNAGSDRAMNFLDDRGNVVAYVNEYGINAVYEVHLAAEEGLDIDGVGDLYGDGAGNLIVDGASFTINLTGALVLNQAVTGASGTVAASLLASQMNISGSVTAIGTVIGGTFSGTTTGKKYTASFRVGSTDNSFIDTNGNFIKAAFSAAQAIYVDGTNGSDTKGNGTDLAPYATITHALSVAASGNAVIVGPGSYSLVQAVVPAGVSLVGSGMDITTINCTATAGYGPCVVVGTGSVVSDLTINSANGHNIPPIGFQAGAGAGSTQTSTLFYLRRIRATGDIDGFYIANKSGYYSALYFECRDCIFASNYDTFQMAAADSTAWPITFDLINCQFLPTRKSGQTNLLRCVTGGAQIVKGRLFNCLLTSTDTYATSASSILGAGIALSSYQGINLELYGNTINYNFPNVTNLSALTNAEWESVAVAGVSSTVLIGAGNSFDPRLMNATGSGTPVVTFLPSTTGKAVSTLAVASSAVTPWCGPSGNQFDVAVDAATLTSNTLTISNPSTTAGIGLGSTSDGMETRYRIKNTNAGSTAMTLSLGSSFNVGSTSVSTIAAGKRAYLTFEFDADNSEWDLTGYSNGL